IGPAEICAHSGGIVETGAGKVCAFQVGAVQAGVLKDAAAEGEADTSCQNRLCNRSTRSFTSIPCLCENSLSPRTWYESHVYARTPSRRERGTNPDSPDDAPEHSRIAEKSAVFCPIPLGPKAFVRAASMTVTRPLTREQTAHGSIRIHARYSWLLSGPRRGWNRFLRTGTLRFGGRPRDNRTLRRNGTRLLTTITSVFSWRKSARPRSNGILSRAFCVYGVGTKLRTTESGRRTPLRSASKSCSACGCRA